MALAVAKLGVKLGLAGGAIYYSIDQGVWGSTDDGKIAALKLKEAIAPAPEVVWQAPPPPQEPSFTDHWNKGVKTVFEGAYNLPELTKEYTQKSVKSVKSLVGVSGDDV